MPWDRAVDSEMELKCATDSRSCCFDGSGLVLGYRSSYDEPKERAGHVRLHKQDIFEEH